ncbi:neprilysin-1-like isoform X2 [Dermatophagoides farinae]|uniref:neprilysin-1-like isoform X2 n=1 Tax=Dermatophagoides farinae TaxID=6954 RepID=UPI003F62B9E6
MPSLSSSSSSSSSKSSKHQSTKKNFKNKKSNNVNNKNKMINKSILKSLVEFWFQHNQTFMIIIWKLVIIMIITTINLPKSSALLYCRNSVHHYHNKIIWPNRYSRLENLNNDDDSFYYDDDDDEAILSIILANGKMNQIKQLPSSSSVQPSVHSKSSSSSSSTSASSSSTSHHHQQYQQCPHSDDHHILLPCTCNASKKEILCRGGGSSISGSATEQLRNTFVYYAKWIPEDMQRFDSIYINLRNLTILEDRLFNGIKFSNILLSGNELKFIDRNAFIGTEYTVYTVFIYGTNLSSELNGKFDFFASIRSLINLQKLIIYQNNLTMIPERAFTTTLVDNKNDDDDDSHSSSLNNTDGIEQTSTPSSSSAEAAAAFSSNETESQLTEIQITTGNIQSIGSDAFADLLHLEQLSLSKNHINFIHAYAFRMNKPSNLTLMIDLTDNDLNSSSFEPESFLGAKRPLKIHLGLNGCNLKLDHLSEEIFRPFLDENLKNTIDVGRHCFNLQCGCRMAWTLSERYRLRVKNFRCSNDRNNTVYFSDYMRNKTCPYYRQTKSTTAPTPQDTSITITDQIKANEIPIDSKDSYRNGSSVMMETITFGDHHRDYCSTKKCSKQGIEMNTYINRSVDPCESFYDYACNGWESKHLLEYLVQFLSNGGSEYDNFVKVQLKIEENFEKLLTIDQDLLLPPKNITSSLSTTTQPPSIELPSKFEKTILATNIRTMYTKCISATKEPDFDILNHVLQDIGGWPLLTKRFDRDQYRWENYFHTIVNQYNDHIFIELESNIDEKQMKYLMIKSGGFIVSHRKLLSVKLNRLESYANYILATASHFGAKNHQNETMDEVWEMIKFEKQLANIAKKSMGPEFMIQRKMETLGCLIQEIDWLYVLNNIQRTHRIMNDSNFAKTKLMFDVHYLIELSRLLVRTDQRIIANYIGWRVMDSIGYQFGGTTFIDIQQNFYSTESREGLKAMKKQCLEPLLQSIPYLMARIFAEKNLPSSARQNAQQIIETVKNSFIESMRKKNWIDEPKRELIEKVEKININVGYPDWVMDDESLENYHSILNYTIPEKKKNNLTTLMKFYSKVQECKILHLLSQIGERVNKSHFWDPLPLHVGATYDYVGHMITIPMGLLQPPFYEDDRPFYLNYASLGSFFGHEMGHSVTPRYSEFDQLLPPWSMNILKDYLFKAQCFVSQYTSYYDKEADLHLDGTRTFEEDMSDLAGIQAAYYAYQDVAKRFLANQTPNGTISNGQSPQSMAIHVQRIQELPEFSIDMLFFISFAQKWCRFSTHVQTRIRISKSVHSPGKYRVNGALSNLDAFAKAFNCPIGSAMNPAKRCESW